MERKASCRVGRLWTPWRMKFILSDKKGGCVFCQKVAETNDRANYLLYRGDHSFIMLNAYPYNNGHLLVVPYNHSPSLEDLDHATLTEVMLLVNRGLAALRKAMNPQGFNIGANLGAVAGAGITDHVHLHIVPRWQGDNNFLPVIDDTRLIPECLDDTYQRLLDAGIADR
ncbi:MAG: HIT family protein [Chloroflexota bacterium]